MCLALPAKIVAIDADTDMATVALGEVKKEVSLALIEDPQINEYVLVHVGYALNKISEEEAEKTLELFAQAGLTTSAGETADGAEDSASTSASEVSK